MVMIVEMVYAINNTTISLAMAINFDKKFCQSYQHVEVVSKVYS